MLRRLISFVTATVMIAVILPLSVSADIDMDDKNYYDRTRIDRYLDVEIWANHDDGEYFEGDNIVLSFRANRDAFVAIYSIDSRGRVNLLFPVEEGDNNYIEGGETYQLPGGYDDFDLVVSGPEGTETIQIIASKEPFPIPEWYPNSGLDDSNWDDRHDFLDYINNRYFVRFDGQRFSYDRLSIYINEWEETYYRPVYYPSYPTWTVCGNVYIDYPYGGSVYINGVYWGIAPLYVPRIYVGWHTLTIYDRYGYCWENDVHISRYNTVILDRHIIRPHSSVVSKYKKVREVGYRNPVNNGYPKYKAVRKSAANELSKNQKIYKGGVVAKTTDSKFQKKYTRGSAKVEKTDRGYEATRSKTEKRDSRKSGSSKTYNKTDSRNSKTDYGSSKTYKKSSKTQSSKKTPTQLRKQSKGDKSSKSSSKKSSTVKKSNKKDKSSKSSSKKSSKYNKKSNSKSSSGKVKKSSGSSKKSSSSKPATKKGSKAPKKTSGKKGDK